jgi:tetratricopeptide (TPR) repeat protein
MARSLDHAFANATSTDHEVLARLYMILANARMSVGDRAAANELYMLSRHHAIECGDQAAIDAVIYNKAAFALAWLRAQVCFGRSDQEQLRQLRVELASAKTYQQLVGVAAFSNFVFLWEARLLVASGDHSSAIPALKAVRSMQPFAKYNFHESLVDLEIAYCYACLGNRELACEAARDAVRADLAQLHDDDKLVAAWLRCKLIEAEPDLGDITAARTLLAQAGQEFDAGCKELREALDGLGTHPHIVRPTVVQPRSTA